MEKDFELDTSKKFINIVRHDKEGLVVNVGGLEVIICPFNFKRSPCDNLNNSSWPVFCPENYEKCYKFLLLITYGINPSYN